MPRFTLQSRIEVSTERVFAWHMRPGAFERLAPPWQRIRVVDRSSGAEGAGMTPGDKVVIELGGYPCKRRWDARVVEVRQDRFFADEQVRGPFAAWRHEHHFEPRGPDCCEYSDVIDYTLPGGAVGGMLGGCYVRGELERIFRFRHARLRGDLACHGAYSDRPRLRVAITGASGLVGSQLDAFLTTGGHSVWRLVRRTPRPNAGEVQWNPATGEVDAAALEGLDAVIHLAGENIAGGRWSQERKRKIAESRVQGTDSLCRALAKLSQPPKTLISASAEGLYGDRGDELLTEESPPGEGFLADVGQAWEAAAEPARQAGIRVVHPRISLVLTAQGGALGTMLPAFRLGVAGPLGRGGQYMSWIALDDLLASFLFAMYDESLEGPYNACAPHVVTNRDFTKTLGRLLNRPTLLAVPSVGIETLLGQMGRDLLLKSTRLVPARLQTAGFAFSHAHLEDALRLELGLLPPFAGSSHEIHG